MQALITGDGSGGMGRMVNLANTWTSTPPAPGHLWAVALVGGDGIRLRDLTVRIVGDNRPKQFCPIVGAESLLRQTRARLGPLVAGDWQVCYEVPAAVVSVTHALADQDLAATRKVNPAAWLRQTHSFSPPVRTLREAVSWQ